MINPSKKVNFIKSSGIGSPRPDFSKMSYYLVADLIKENGPEIIFPLWMGGANFTRMPDYCLAILIEAHGISILPLLKKVGTDFSEIGCCSFDYELIQAHGINMIITLEEVGANLKKTSGYKLSNIICDYGAKIIVFFKRANTDFSEIGGFNLRKIIEIHGSSIIAPLKEAGADFSKIKSHELGKIIETHGSSILAPLKEAGISPNALTEFYDLWIKNPSFNKDLGFKEVCDGLCQIRVEKTLEIETDAGQVNEVDVAGQVNFDV